MLAVTSSQPVDMAEPSVATSSEAAVKTIESDEPDMEASESAFKKCLKFGGCGGFGN